MTCTGQDRVGDRVADIRIQADIGDRKLVIDEKIYFSQDTRTMIDEETMLSTNGWCSTVDVTFKEDAVKTENRVITFAASYLQYVIDQNTETATYSHDGRSVDLSCR